MKKESNPPPVLPRPNPPPAPPASDGYRKLGSLFVPESVTETQPIVNWFATEMERQLAAAKHKDSPAHWRSTDVFSLKKRLWDCRANLNAATNENPTQVLQEAAAMANVLLMIADWYESRLVILDIDGTE